MKTWMLESLTVMAILAIVITVHKISLPEIICGIAVWVSFMHAQVADRMLEKQAKLAVPDVHCYKWATRYFLTKELLWILFFILTKTYSAITGSVVFFLYPFWRKMYNRHFRYQKKIAP